MHTLVWLLVAAAAFVAMEGLAWLAHRFVMHGWGWGWHRSHHERRGGSVELNDGFSVIGAALTLAVFWLAGVLDSPWLQAAAVGMTAYGIAYWLVHDGLVHQRWPLRWVPRGGYLRRLVQAHRLHHAVRTREGAISFGFLVVPDPKRLATHLQARQRARCS